ncbi:PAS domain-containing protein [Deinococcus malanensis]|uniref:PAS domain-containing protein n=1 Tax=Deinococcus malanensis TaxID=1706855 RepID=UPI003643B4C9
MCQTLGQPITYGDACAANSFQQWAARAGRSAGCGLPHPTWATDQQGRVLAVNPALLTYCGLEENTLIGHFLESLVHPENHEQLPFPRTLPSIRPNCVCAAMTVSTVGSSWTPGPCPGPPESGSHLPPTSTASGGPCRRWANSIPFAARHR